MHIEYEQNYNARVFLLAVCQNIFFDAQRRKRVALQWNISASHFLDSLNLRVKWSFSGLNLFFVILKDTEHKKAMKWPQSGQEHCRHSLHMSLAKNNFWRIETCEEGDSSERSEAGRPWPWHSQTRPATHT